MQKFVHLGLACAVTLGLAACGGGGGGDDKKNSSSSAGVSSLATSSSSTVSSSSVSSSQSSMQVSSVESSSKISVVSSSVSSSSDISSLSVSTSSQVSSANSSSQVSSSSSSSEDTVNLTGMFVDSAVAGIGYRTETKNGFTNEKGEYDYVEGETVTFFIGDLELPSVPAKGVITPLDLAESDNLENQVVLNISILLQSLDGDGDLSNGIQINYADIDDAAVAVNFDQPVNTFSAAITDLVTEAGNSVVSEADATEHLQDTLDNLETINAKRLIGTWYMRQQDADDDYYIIIAFLDESHYIAMDIDGSDGTDIEAGTYNWNIETGLVTVDIRVDSNDQLGFSDGSYRILKSGDQLLMSEDGMDEEPVPMIKLNSDSSSSLVGGWYMQEEGLDILVAFTEEQYFMGQYSAADENGNPGVESGSYTYSSDTGEIRFTTTLDTNGQWGFSHPCAVLDLEESNNLNCGPEGSEIIQTMTKAQNQLVFVSEADTIDNNGEEQPSTFTAVEE